MTLRFVKSLYYQREDPIGQNAPIDRLYAKFAPCTEIKAAANDDGAAGLVVARLVYNGDDLSIPITDITHYVPHDQVHIASVVVLPNPAVLGPVPAAAAAPAGEFAIDNMPHWLRPEVEAIINIRDTFRARAGGRRIVSLPFFLFGDDFGRRTRSFGANYK